MPDRTAVAALVTGAALLAVTGCSSSFGSDRKTTQDTGSK
jgi:multiple sugar transport system substrate-binding protein